MLFSEEETREGVDLWDPQGGVEGGESVVGMYYMRDGSIFNIKIEKLRKMKFRKIKDLV